MTRLIIILATIISSLCLYGGSPETGKKGTKTTKKEVYVIQYGNKKLLASNKTIKQLDQKEIKGINVMNDTIFLSVSEKAFSDFKNKKRK